MVVTIDCRDTINCKVTIVLCNRAQVIIGFDKITPAKICIFHPGTDSIRTYLFSLSILFFNHSYLFKSTKQLCGVHSTVHGQNLESVTSQLGQKVD